MADNYVEKGKIPENSLKWTEFLSTAKERLHRALEAQGNDSNRALDDLRFTYKPEEYQWDDAVKRKRKADQRPCLVYNKLPSFVNRIKNSMRMNRYSIRVRPADGDSDKELADLRSGLIRNIEQVSDAEDAQDMAGQLAVACGRGWLRVASRYVSEDSFEQELYLMAMPNAFCVSWDPAARRADLQDADWIFVSETISKDAYKREYPDRQPASVDAHPGVYTNEWDKGETVRIAEYFHRDEPKQKKLYLCDLINPQGEQMRKIITGEEKKRAEELGWTVTVLKTRTVTERPWMRAKISGTDVLEEPREEPGKYHPVVPVWGERIDIDGETLTWGAVRHMKDPQRSFNYSRSTMVERAALEPKAPWVIGKNQLKGFEKEWEKSRTDNVPYLRYNDDPTGQNPIAPPQRNFPEQASTALISVVQMDTQDMHDISGIQPTAMGKNTSEKAGIAIAQRRQEGDVATFTYPDNMAKSWKWLGRILLDRIPYVYDSARVVRTRGEDKSENMVPINTAREEMFPPNYRGPKVESEVPGAGKMFNDMSVGRYDLVVDVGPQMMTQRQEVLAGLFEFLNVYPPAAPILGDIIAENQDWPGSQQVAKRLKKLVPPEIREPEEGEEQQQPQPPAPDPQLILALQKMELEQARLQFDMARAKEELDIKRLDTEVKAIKMAAEAEAAEKGQQLEQYAAFVKEFMNAIEQSESAGAGPG